MLILAFDTATDLATSALVADGVTLGERTSRPQSLLADVDALLAAAGAAPAELTGIVVGTGPGSFTGTRIGLSVARGLALSLDLPVAGISTLDALAAAADGAFPVIDARRGEVFVLGPVALRPEEVVVPSGSICIGDGARRYRDILAASGRRCLRTAPSCMYRARRCTPLLATSFGPADAVQPVYVREPDARRWVA